MLDGTSAYASSDSWQRVIQDNFKADPTGHVHTAGNYDEAHVTPSKTDIFSSGKQLILNDTQLSDMIMTFVHYVLDTGLTLHTHQANGSMSACTVRARFIKIDLPS